MTDQFGDAVVETRGITKAFGTVTAVKDLNLSVPRGAVFAYLGPNGAGKTTTLRILLSLLHPTRGTSYLFGVKVTPGVPVLRRVGALVERPAFYPYLTARENLRVFDCMRDSPPATATSRIDRVLDRVGLTAVASRRVGGFSTGMRQRLGVGLALLDDPPLVILDEPTAGMDPEGMVDIRRLVRELHKQGATVLLSTHLLDEAEQVCTHIALLNRGRLLFSGTLADVLTAKPHLWLRFSSEAEYLDATMALRRVGLAAQADGHLSCRVDGELDGSSVARLLAQVAVYPAEIALRRDSLEQLYFKLAGMAASGDEA